MQSVAIIRLSIYSPLFLFIVFTKVAPNPMRTPEYTDEESLKTHSHIQTDSKA